MADLTITAANVSITTNADRRLVVAGQAASIGDLVFRSGGAEGQYHLVDTDALISAPADQDGSEYGLALSTAAAQGQPLVIARDGATVVLGSGVVTTNGTYYGSTTAGKISDTAAASGDFGVVVGTATSSSTLPLNFHASGVATT